MKFFNQSLLGALVLSQLFAQSSFADPKMPTNLPDTDFVRYSKVQMGQLNSTFYQLELCKKEAPKCTPIGRPYWSLTELRDAYYDSHIVARALGGSAAAVAVTGSAVLIATVGPIPPAVAGLAFGGMMLNEARKAPPKSQAQQDIDKVLNSIIQQDNFIYVPVNTKLPMAQVAQELEKKLNKVANPNAAVVANTNKPQVVYSGHLIWKDEPQDVTSHELK